MNFLLLGRTIINVDQIAYISFRPSFDDAVKATVVFSAATERQALEREFEGPLVEELKTFFADKTAGKAKRTSDYGKGE
jgi:hypothetical protein